jgi:hypothetical protein
MKIQVESYAGYKGEEYPLRFRMQNHLLEIEEVVDRWYGPDDVYFRVRASDGNVYVLRNKPQSGWTLESYRLDPRSRVTLTRHCGLRTGGLN